MSREITLSNTQLTVDGDITVRGTMSATSIVGAAAGLQGTTGTQGVQGLTGSGTQGTQGITGTQGVSGVNGVNGTDGTDGVQGIAGLAGTNGLNGTNGSNGVNTAVVYAYKWGTAVATDQPNTDRTYTFDGATWNNYSGGNGWTLGQIPAKGDNTVLSVCVAVASSTSSTDVVAASDWGSPQILTQDGADGQNGTAGTNTAVVYAYKRSSSALASDDKPSTTRTWTYSTATFNNNDLGDSWSGTIPTGTDDLYFCVAVASSTNTTDDIVAADWTAPQLFSSNGRDGTDAVNTAVVYAYKWGNSVASDTPITTRTYTFATSTWSSTDGGNGWTLGQIPTKSTNTVLSVCIAIASSTSSTDNVVEADWSSAQILTQDGTNGTNGTNGVNTATVYAYKRSATALAANDKPSTTRTWTFSSGTWNNNDLGSSWSGENPTGTDDLYFCVAVASSTSTTDDVITADWTAPQLFASNGTDGTDGTNGNDGVNTAVLYAYKWGTVVAADKPSTTRTYTFATSSWSSTDGGNSWTLGEIPAKGSNTVLSVCVAVASSTSSTDSVTAADWGSAQILTQDGSTGPAGTNTAVVYAYKRSASALLSTDKPSTTRTWTYSTATFNDNDLGGSWSGTIPTGTDDLYFCVAVASSTSTTDSIVAADWTAPQLFSSNGTDGTDGTNGNDGVNTAVLYAYKWGTAVATNKPITTRTYTFATTAWDNTDGGNGWTLSSVPAKGANTVLSICTGIASGTGATDSVTTDDWSSPQILAQDGVNGTNGDDGSTGPRRANGFIYRYSSTAGTAPTGGSITWSTGVLTPPTGWSNNDPGTPSSGDSLYVSYWSAAEDTFGGTTTITYTTPVLGVTNVNDVRSINYDGPTTPTPDSFGTTGYYLDASAGNAVFNNIFLRDNIITADAVATGIVAQQSSGTGSWSDNPNTATILSVSVAADALSSLVVWLVGRSPYDNVDNDGRYQGSYGLISAPTGVSTQLIAPGINTPVSNVILLSDPAAGTYNFGFTNNLASDTGNAGYLTVVAIGFK